MHNPMQCKCTAYIDANASRLHEQKPVYARPRPEARSQKPDEQRSVGSLRSPTGATAPLRGVENSGNERPPAPATWTDVMREIRRTAGLGRLPEGEIRRSASIAKQWREAGRSLDEIVWAIQGWRALTDRGVTWLRAREPFTLRALRNTRCVVEHHSGERVVRAAFEVAVEASPTPRRPTRKPAGSSQLSSVADLIARLVPHA